MEIVSKYNIDDKVKVWYYTPEDKVNPIELYGVIVGFKYDVIKDTGAKDNIREGIEYDIKTSIGVISRQEGAIMPNNI